MNILNNECRSVSFRHGRTHNIATALYTHKDDEICLDTLDSIQTWMTDKVMVVVDEANIHNYSNRIKDAIVKIGLYHGSTRSTHKNMAFAILELYKQWDDVDWYCFVESDVLILNNLFKKDLKGGWILGTQQRRGPEWDLPLLNKIIKTKSSLCCYFLGCIMFLHQDFIKKLIEIDFFNRFFDYTKAYESHEFPGFQGYSFQEVLFPSVAYALNKESDVELSGTRYVCNWPVDIQPHELSPDTSIVHPIKDINNPIRQHYKKIREMFKNDV